MCSCVYLFIAPAVAVFSEVESAAATIVSCTCRDTKVNLYYSQCVYTFHAVSNAAAVCKEEDGEGVLCEGGVSILCVLCGR